MTLIHSMMTIFQYKAKNKIVFNKYKWDHLIIKILEELIIQIAIQIIIYNR